MKKNQSGFSTLWLLGFAGLILLCGLIIFDMTRVYVEREKLITAADASANAGASAVDEALLGDPVNPKVKLDPSEAVARCNQMLDTYAASGGSAHSILDSTTETDSKTKCEIDPSDENAVIATASGKVKFSLLFDLLGKDAQELKVTSRAKPSCSDSSC